MKEYNEMSFGEQLKYAHKHKLMNTGNESKVQDGVQDPFQDDSQDPWKGKEEARGAQDVYPSSAGARQHVAEAVCTSGTFGSTSWEANPRIDFPSDSARRTQRRGEEGDLSVFLR